MLTDDVGDEMEWETQPNKQKVRETMKYVLVIKSDLAGGMEHPDFPLDSPGGQDICLLPSQLERAPGECVEVLSDVLNFI